VQWQGEIHETLNIPARTKEVHLKGDLLHFSYYSIEEDKKQTERFSDLSAQWLYSKRKKPSLIKKFLSPVIKFTRDYFFKRGFLDGYYGFIICKLSARSVFLKYHKLQKLYKK
jgi:hypothetical protein